MTPELKQKWIDALRSGTYKQGYKTLHPRTDFCCLGVLCDIAGYEWTQEDATLNPHHSCAAGTGYIEADDEAEKLGLPTEIQRICYSMNDATWTDADQDIVDRFEIDPNHRYSFAEIADFLEKNL